MNIRPAFLIAGGLGVLGGGYLLLSGGKDKPGATPESKDPGAALPTGTAVSPATTAPAAGSVLAPAPGTAGAATAPAATGSGVRSQQMGPYTILDDGSGVQMVFETATQQPVGVLDAQGNLVPVTVDAAGNIAIAPSANGAATSAATTTAPTTTAPMTATATTSATGQATAGASPYASIAEELFTNAGNPAIGAASSAPMAGAATLGQATTPTSTTSPVATSNTGVRSEQVGTYTVLDDGSGTKVILDTASQQPVGVMDVAGNVTPITVDAAGNVSVTGSAATTAAPVAATPSPQSYGAGTSAMPLR